MADAISNVVEKRGRLVLKNLVYEKAFVRVEWVDSVPGVLKVTIDGKYSELAKGYFKTDLEAERFIRSIMECCGLELSTDDEIREMVRKSLENLEELEKRYGAHSAFKDEAVKEFSRIMKEKA